MTTIAVVVATYGDKMVWGQRARRALDSIEEQSRLPDEWSWVHGDTLHQARNQAVLETGADWVVCLDADDQLDSCYVEAMCRKAQELGAGDWLIQPSTLGVYPDGREDEYPVLIPARRSLCEANWMVIGTMFRRTQFERVHGFQDEELYEDWALWLRCWIDGAHLATCPEAIYRVGVRDQSRNFPDRDLQIRVYNRIRDANLPVAAAKGLPT